MKKPKIGLWAVWHYSHMPFACLGKITSLVPLGKYPNPDGRQENWVETREFGKGNLFRAARVISESEAKAMNEALNELADEYSIVSRSLHEAYTKQAQLIHGLPKKTK